jgi:hypothetical protein
MLVHRSRISYTPKREAMRSSETSVNKISARRLIPEDAFFDILYISIDILSLGNSHFHKLKLGQFCNKNHLSFVVQRMMEKASVRYNIQARGRKQRLGTGAAP